MLLNGLDCDWKLKMNIQKEQSIVKDTWLLCPGWRKAAHQGLGQRVFQLASVRAVIFEAEDTGQWQLDLPQMNIRSTGYRVPCRKAGPGVSDRQFLWNPESQVLG